VNAVLVIGSGVQALMVAVALARRLPGVRVARLDLDVVDRVEETIGATRPSIRTFHATVGIDEAEIVARTRAGYRLGTQVSGWGAGAFFRGHGLYGESLSGVPFHHLWLRAERSGTAAPFDSFSISAVLAARGQFAAPSSLADSPLAALDYGLQLELTAYGQALRGLGRAAGVDEVRGKIAAVEKTPDGDCVRGVRLGDGRELTADLYVDTGGAIRRVLPSRWVDWSKALPVDRLLLLHRSAVSKPHDSLLALDAGWRYETGDVTAAGYSSEYGDVPGAVALRQGRLEDPWRGNCVAIGSAAVSLEPSAATSLHIVCRHIERLVACWPGHDSRAAPAEIAFFNRRMALEADRMRDFVQLPYLLNRRPEPFWRAAAAGPVSPQLARDLALFRERGRLAIHDEDGFERDGWVASLIGFGLRPHRMDAVAAELPMERIQQRLEAIRAGLR